MSHAASIIDEWHHYPPHQRWSHTARPVHHWNELLTPVCKVRATQHVSKHYFETLIFIPDTKVRSYCPYGMAEGSTVASPGLQPAI
jgi:hypothetical protein